MGKIKKLKDVELVGGTEQSDVYPITSTKAIYDESNKRLDSIISELQKSADSSLETENKTVVGSINELKRLRDKGYLFKGVATPDTNPGVVKQKVFYIANGKGTYTNFSNLEVTEDEVVVLCYDTDWHKLLTGIASQAKLTELEEKIIGKELVKHDLFIDDSGVWSNGMKHIVLPIKGGDMFTIRGNSNVSNQSVFAFLNDYKIPVMHEKASFCEGTSRIIKIGNYSQLAPIDAKFVIVRVFANEIDETPEVLEVNGFNALRSGGIVNTKQNLLKDTEYVKMQNNADGSSYITIPKLEDLYHRSLVKYDLFIDASGIWSNGMKHIVLPVNGGDMFTINGNSNVNNQSAFAFLKNYENPIRGKSVEFCEGTTRYVKYGLYSQQIPADAKYVIIRVENGITDELPEILEVNGDDAFVELNNSILDLKQDLLIAGDNIHIKKNTNGTATISVKEASYDRVADFIKDNSVSRALIGNTKFKKTPNGSIINLDDSRCLTSEKLVKIYDRTSGFGIFAGIDLDGKLIFFSNYYNTITYMDNYDDQEAKVLYNMWELNADFAQDPNNRKTEIRYLWVLNNGNMLIYGATLPDSQAPQPNANIGGLWLLNRNTNVIKKVLTFRNSYIRLYPYWSIEIVENRIFFSEYGNSDGTEGLGHKGDATKLWESIDYGETFHVLFDFKNVATDNIPNEMHIHSVHYDRLYKRIWVNTGDNHDLEGNASIRINWSDDEGKTWKTKKLNRYFGEGTTARDNIKCLSMYSDKDFLVFGGDDYQNTIYRSVRKDDDVILEPVYRYLPSYEDRVTQFTAKFRRLSNGLIVVPIIFGDSAPRNIRIVGTFDGVKWYELFETEYVSSTTSPNFGTLVEKEGKLIFDYSIQTDEGAYSRHLVVFNIPMIN